MTTYLEKLQDLARKDFDCNFETESTDEAQGLFVDCLEEADIDPLNWILAIDLDGPRGNLWISSTRINEDMGGAIYSFSVQEDGKFIMDECLGDSADKAAARIYKKCLVDALNCQA